MAGEALFIGWGTPVRSRETTALEVFNESVQYWGSLQQDGKIESFDVFLLAPHGGDLGGFALLRGERGALDSLLSEDEFLRQLTRANHIVEGLGVVRAYGGESLGEQMQRFQQATEELG